MRVEASVDHILGNTITQESVIRSSLEIDEGDPFNELLNAKSINNLRSLNIFGDIKVDVNDGSSENTKVIDIEVKEKPTGEISLGAGYTMMVNDWLAVEPNISGDGGFDLDNLEFGLSLG